MSCTNCNYKKLKKENLNGRSYPWKGYYRVELTVDFKANVCESCNEVNFKYSDYEKLDDALMESIHKTQRACIGVLVKKNITQIMIAKALGITPEYVSDAKSGKKELGPTIFTLLKVFAENPQMIEEYSGVKVEINEYKNIEKVERVTTEYNVIEYSWLKGTSGKIECDDEELVLQRLELVQ